MRIVASYDLCKEFFDLTGNDRTAFVWVKDGKDVCYAYRISEEVITGRYPILCPAYSIMDLSDMLPDETQMFKMPATHGKYKYRFFGSFTPFPLADDDNMSDAALKLLIELRKQRERNGSKISNNR